MPSMTTRSIALLSLIVSAGALVVAFASLRGDSTPALREQTALAIASARALQDLLPGPSLDRDAAAREHYMHTDVSDYATYTHPRYGFSFDYAADFTVQTFDDPAGEVVLVTNPALDMGLQIFMQPFDEPSEALTLARIRRDVPDFEVAEAVERHLSYTDIPAIYFRRFDPVIGELREAWFAYNGVLYQIMMHAPDQELLGAWYLWTLNNSWRFGGW